MADDSQIIGRVPESTLPLLQALRRYRVSAKDAEQCRDITQALALAVAGEQLANSVGMYLAVLAKHPNEALAADRRAEAVERREAV